MYNDYPTASYSSNVDQFLFLKIGGIVLLLAVLIVIPLISGMKLFKKANRNGISALIPFHHLITLIEICNLPKMYFLFLLIPGANFIFYYKICTVLSMLFKKDDKFKYGLFLLPFIYYPILGFGKSEYAGINLVGMDSRNQVSRIDVIDENKNQEIEVEENTQEDVSTRNINISVGGGKYQKDYTTNLDHIEGDMVITQRNINEKKKKIEEQKMKEQEMFIKHSEFEKHRQEELRKQREAELAAMQEPVDESKKLVDDVFDINYIQTVGGTKEEKPEKIEEEVPVEPPKPEIEYVVCPKCGTKVPKGTEFCITCGTKL